MTEPKALSQEQRAELVAKAKAAGIGGYVQFVPASTILALEATVQALTVERDAALERVKALEAGVIDVAAPLAAAISLLEGGGKKAAPSNKMFDLMLSDYRASLARARALLTPKDPGHG